MLLIVFIAGGLIGAALHRATRNLLGACFGASILTTLLVWLAASNHFGWMDRTFFENVFICMLTSFGAAMFVGLWTNRKRR